VGARRLEYWKSCDTSHYYYFSFLSVVFARSSIDCDFERVFFRFNHSFCFYLSFFSLSLTPLLGRGPGVVMRFVFRGVGFGSLGMGGWTVEPVGGKKKSYTTAFFSAI
jgi:hypothetical protein